MSDNVNIEGLNKADVLAALYNASQPMGMGFLQAAGGPVDMDREYAEKLLRSGSDTTGDYPEGYAAMIGGNQSFDYLYGRPMKLNLSDDEFSPRGYDRDNGGDGAAQKVIDYLRETGNVLRSGGDSFGSSAMTEDQSAMFMWGALQRAAHEKRNGE